MVSRLPIVLLPALLALAPCTHAASLLQDAVTEMRMVTDRGDVVSVTTDGMVLSQLTICIQGREVDFDLGRIHGLEGPYLDSVKLMVDDRRIDGDYVRIVVIPFHSWKQAHVRGPSLVIEVTATRILAAKLVHGANFDDVIHTF